MKSEDGGKDCNPATSLHCSMLSRCSKSSNQKMPLQGSLTGSKSEDTVLLCESHCYAGPAIARKFPNPLRMRTVAACAIAQHHVALVATKCTEVSEDKLVCCCKEQGGFPKQAREEGFFGVGANRYSWKACFSPNTNWEFGHQV